ncbi:MAG: ABC transporter substrate-binding protein [Crocinitomicaceae bacterium]
MRALIFLVLVICTFINQSCENAENSAEHTILPGHIIPAKGGKFYGDTLKVNSNEVYTALFPASIADIYSQHISSQIYEGLLKFNPNNLKIEPCIAESYHIDSANSKYTFKLRKNVYFHDNPCFTKGKGRTVTAKDVQFVFEFLCSNHPLNTSPILWKNYIAGANDFYSSKADHVTGIEVIDEQTISVKLNEPFSGFLNMLALNQTAIFPKEVLDFYGDQALSHAAVGTGPFILKSVEENILLEKNRKYWRRDEFGNQLPFLSYIDIQFTNDKSEELAKFKNGEIDFIWGLPVEEIQNVIGSLEEAKLGKNKEFNVQSINNLQAEYYIFSFADSVFKDIHLRRALNYAIDKSFIASYVLEGSVLPANNGLIPDISGYKKSLSENYKFNPTKARKELKLSNYQPSKEDHMITLYYNNTGDINKPVAEAIKKQLKDILNIDLKLEESDRKTFFEKISNEELPFWRYGWIADYPDPANFMASFHSKNIKGSTNNSNKSQFSNPEFDLNFDKAMAEVDDEKRLNFLAEAEQIIMQEAAIIPLFYFTSIRLVNPKLKDLPINELEFRDYSITYFSNKKKKNVRVYDDFENID